MPASIVQFKEDSVYVGSPTVSRSTGNFGASCTAGNWILAWGTVPASPIVSASFSDTLATSYSTVIAHILDGSTFIQIDAVIGKLTSSGTNAVTYAAVGTDRIGVAAIELAGLHATTPYVATERSGWNYQASPGTGTDAVTSTNTPALGASAGILIGLSLDAQSGSFAYPNIGTGFTNIGQAWNGIAQNARFEHKQISSAAAVAALFTATANVPHLSMAVFLREAAAANKRKRVLMHGVGH